MSNPVPTDSARPRQRRIALLALATLFGLIAIGYGIYWFVFESHYESTDNAYVGGNLVLITPQVSGTVLSIDADETDFVRAGQPLVKLDPADARVALEQAEAQLGQTVREVRTLFANDASLAAAVALRDAEVAKAQSDVAKAQDDLARRQSLASTGAVSVEEIKHAATALASARSALAAAQAAASAAREQLVANQALTAGTTVSSHPNVQRAAARVREAYLALSRVELPAPVTGYVARRSVQVGSRVQTGTPLMAIVPLDRVWVDANFKEVQLRNLRIGQPVTLTADLYGTRVEYHGTVAGLGVGTGAAFALLPAQNATGNWIKVVQRVPVRIALDQKELAAHPLRVGLSMEVTVDVSDRSGKMLAEAPRTQPIATTDVFPTSSRGADAVIERIIAANLAGSAGKPKPAPGGTRAASLATNPVD
ncbi:MAG: HlyD family efflux transporter periplasmic adaptor subunit [Gemmatimonadota bacterium]